MNKLISLSAAIAISAAAALNIYAGNPGASMSFNPEILIDTESAVAAADPADPVYITKDYDYKDFIGISASGVVEVQLVKSNTWKVSVTLPKDLEQYLRIGVTKGELRIGVTNIPNALLNKLKDYEVTAKIAMPQLRSLELSGASSFHCKDAFDIGDHEFEMELSGASKASTVNIKAREFDLEMGGACSAVVKGVFKTANIEMSGASKGNFEIDADRLEQEIGGAAKAYHKGDFGDIESETSGASMFSLKGSVERLSVEGSGAAKIETFDCETEEAKVNLSGAAYCELNASKNITVDISGGSSLRYKERDDLNINTISIGRAASIKKVK